MSVDHRIVNFQHYVSKRLQQINKQLAGQTVTEE
jgi:hypothetical protein